jgi:hypothetical protein
MTSVTSQVVEARIGKTTTANKLAVLQKIKQEKDVLFGSYFNNLVTHKKSEKWKEVTKLAESLGLALTVILQHVMAGADPDFVEPKAYTFFGAFFNNNNTQLLIKN